MYGREAPVANDRRRGLGPKRRSRRLSRTKGGKSYFNARQRYPLLLVYVTRRGECVDRNVYS